MYGYNPCTSSCEAAGLKSELRSDLQVLTYNIIHKKQGKVLLYFNIYYIIALVLEYIYRVVYLWMFLQYINIVNY